MASDSAMPRASHMTDAREGQEDIDIGRLGRRTALHGNPSQSYGASLAI